MMAVATIETDCGFGRIGLLIVALLRKAWKAIDRRNSTGAKAQLGGMRHWHRRHTKGEEQTNYDVKPPVHLLCRLASLELKRKRIILHFTRVTLEGSSDPCKGYSSEEHKYEL